MRAVVLHAPFDVLSWVCGSDLSPYRIALEDVAEAYAAMDQRRAIKSLLRP